MSKRIDLTHRKFSFLTVTGFSHVHNTHAYWKCHCSFCENETVVCGNNLVSGNTTRCKHCAKRKLSRAESLSIYAYWDNHDYCSIASLCRKFGYSRNVIKRALRLPLINNNV